MKTEIEFKRKLWTPKCKTFANLSIGDFFLGSGSGGLYQKIAVRNDSWGNDCHGIWRMAR